MMTTSRFPVNHFSSPGGLRILLVEPNVLAALSIKRGLVERLSASVEIAGSDVEAINVIRDAPVQLAIVDAGYLYDGGSRLFSALNAVAIPIIAVGDGSGQGDIAVITLAKPYTINILIEAIAQLKLHIHP